MTASAVWPEARNIPLLPALETVGLTREFVLADSKVTALDHVNFRVRQGEFVAIMGPSGGGKSTLLSLLGGLDVPSEGKVLIGGQDLYAMSEQQRVELRRGTLGYIFQGYDLLPALTVQENVEFPLLVAGVSLELRRVLALRLLKDVGLEGKELFLPEELSGGQQQRVGIARCLAGHPKIVLADEPTGNLDTATTTDILKLLRAITQERQMTLIVVTHDPEVATQADRTVRLRDGRLELKP
jgi:putative ABC transport system ATP-binding protein